MVGTGYLWKHIRRKEGQEWRKWRKEGDKREGSWRKERTYFYSDFSKYIYIYISSKH